MQQNEVSATYKSAPNIALVKYWGKFNQNEIIPINDSIGLTLNTDDISTTTTCTFTKNKVEDSFVLNHKPSKITNRMVNVLAKIRQRVRTLQPYSKMTEEEWSQYHFKIVSENSFPSASGMASSASGYSCLVACLNKLFGGIFDDVQLSLLARSGSGSASRSMFGGLVLWKGVQLKYLNSQGSPFCVRIEGEQLQQVSRNSISFSTVPSQNLSFIKIIALVTENKQKEISSTIGMRNSLETSPSIRLRNSIAKQRINEINSFLQSINCARVEGKKEQEYQFYDKFAQLVIRDSNSFHAVCQDTYPPIFYMNEFSKQIVKMVDHIINKESKLTKVAYTFDAGPHGFLFVHQDMIESVLSYLYTQFNCNSQILNAKAKKIIESTNLQQVQQYTSFTEQKIIPRGIWVTDVGRGPQPAQVKHN